MLKICPVCRRTFSGGKLCLNCTTEDVALLDVADASVRKAHLREGELRVTIRTYYGARSAMLMLFWGILGGLALGVALLRKGMISEPGRGWPFLFAAAVASIGIPAITAFVGARVVHLFSKSCRGRPLQGKDIRVVRTRRASASSLLTGEE